MHRDICSTCSGAILALSKATT
ncbi:hypothetical protein STAN_5261 [Streptomyces sp. CBMAI 2042]|nr:hypothetical protein STAN_5261 [Streptomyces sp. CBMAI 2042]